MSRSGRSGGRASITLGDGCAGRRADTVHLPPSLGTVFGPHEREVIGEFGLMGRVTDLAALAAALEPV